MEKNEWKFFKETVSGVKSLKKCGKKLPRYCDKNKDKEITLTEWLECLSSKYYVTTKDLIDKENEKHNYLIFNIVKLK